MYASLHEAKLPSLAIKEEVEMGEAEMLFQSLPAKTIIETSTGTNVALATDIDKVQKLYQEYETLPRSVINVCVAYAIKKCDGSVPVYSYFDTILKDWITKGIVTFKTAPADGTNNVVITAYKTDQEYIDSIKKCKFAISYGGANNSRIFIGGNGANYYFSDVLDPTYFPEQNYSPVGNNSGDITGFGEQYDVLVVFTNRETYGVEYQVKDDGTGYFTQVLINGRVGCDCPNTIQLIQNRLTWLTTYDGVCTMVSTSIEDERNIMPISRNVNPKLLKEANLKQAVSIDYDEKLVVKKFKDEKDLYLYDVASVAPDSWRNTERFKNSDLPKKEKRKHSHFSNNNEFVENYDVFKNKYINNINNPFIFGYMIHLMTDNFWRIEMFYKNNFDIKDINNELLNVEHLDEKSELTHDVDIHLKDIASYYNITELKELTEEEINLIPKIDEMTYEGINTTIRYINKQMKEENLNKPIRYTLEDVINGIEICTKKIVNEIDQMR